MSFTAVFDDLRVDASAANVNRMQAEFQTLLLREAVVAPNQEQPLLQMEVMHAMQTGSASCSHRQKQQRRRRQRRQPRRRTARLHEDA